MKVRVSASSFSGIHIMPARILAALIPPARILSLLILLAAPHPAQQRVERLAVGPGCRYTSLSDAQRELAVFSLSVDLHHPRITIHPVTAESLPDRNETVAAMAHRLDRPGYRVLAAVNADFFAGGRPVGLCITVGRLLKTGRGWSSLTLSVTKIPTIGRFRPSLILIGESGVRLAVEGFNVPAGRAPAVLFSRDFYRLLSVRPGRSYYVLSASQPGVPTAGTRLVEMAPAVVSQERVEIPAGKWILVLNQASPTGLPVPPSERIGRLEVRLQPEGPQVWHAVSGGPRLLRGGRISVEREEEGQRPGFDTERHPRTAVGYSGDGRYLILTVVDGRRPGYSRGMDLFELAALMREFGCSEALNLDGGGSSTMVIRGEVVNRPSDPNGARAVANALLVVQTGPAGIH